MNLNQAIEFVCTHLKTESKYKGHGYLDQYRDDKIRLIYDTYHPNMWVSIWLNNDWVEVYSKSGSFNTPDVYKQGAWEKYIFGTLLPQAQEKQQEKERIKKEKEAKEYSDKYGKIDDAKVFS